MEHAQPPAGTAVPDNPAGRRARLAVIPLIWGFLDLGAVLWYMGYRIYQHQIPFYQDYMQAVTAMRIAGGPWPLLGCIVSIILYLTLLASGVLLVRRDTRGAILAYVQTPFRLLLLIPPSLFFILWPWHAPSFAFSLYLLLASEILKLATTIIWHRRTRPPACVNA